MKFVLCVPDGCADLPSADLDGRTPLEVADMPVLSALAARGTVGANAVIPAGMAPGSDVGNLSLFGFDPARYHTGRAPIEAAALGIRLADDQVAFRCNLSTVDMTSGGDGTMVDFAGGHPTTEAATAAIRALDAEIGSGAGAEISFHPGVQYRHIMVAPASWADTECVPPHDLTGDPAVWPTGPSANRLRSVMEASREVLARFDDLEANQTWLWGQGTQPHLPTFTEAYGIRAGLVTAVDLVRGLGVLTNMDIVEIPGATGWFDTDYEGKRDAALDALAAGTDLFVIHVEATDEAGHAGSVSEKITALENWDSRILAGLVDGLDQLGSWRLLLSPDHATPWELRTHTSDPVPYLLVDSDVKGPGGVYSEAAISAMDPVPGHHLMGRLLAR